MRSRSRKKFLVMATVPAALIMTAVPAGVAVAATQSSTTAGGPQQHYIVILHNQNSNLGARSAARRTAISAEQKPVLAQVRSLGGQGYLFMSNSFYPPHGTSGCSTFPTPCSLSKTPILAAHDLPE